MTDEFSPQEVSTIDQVFERASDYRTIYTNQIQLGQSSFDIQMMLAQQTVREGKAYNEILATVLMSPQEAKVLAILLPRVIEAYEKKFGTVSIPQKFAVIAGGKDKPKAP